MKTSLVLALILAPALASAGSVKLPQQYARNLEATDAQRARTASAFLASAQSDFGELRATWPFQARSKAAAPNAAGIIARALLLPGQDHEPALAAAKAWAKGRAADLEAGRPLFDPDVEGLAEVSKALSDPALLAAAVKAFEQRHGMASGEEIVERLFMVRRGEPSLVGFDASLTVRAALAVGDRAKALDVAKALAATAARWDKPSDKGFDLTGRAAVLEALSLAAAQPELAAKLRAKLLETQQKDGAWGQRNTQATAYAVRALALSDQPAAAEAAERGRRFLRLTQLESGGWGTFNDFLPEPFVGETVYEVTAEVVLALTR